MNDTIKELDSICDSLRDIENALNEALWSSGEEEDLILEAGGCIDDAIDRHNYCHRLFRGS